MQLFNICVPKKYMRGNEEKTAWNTVGKLVKFPATPEKSEGYVLEFYMLPNTTFKVFPQKEREPVAYNPQQTQQVDTGEINPEDIPF